MGAEEPVPFGARKAAEAFVEVHGGEIVTFEEVPEDYVLGPTDGTAGPQLKEGAHDEH
jgi:copper chaperone NosL